jgi:hypothetical protein
MVLVEGFGGSISTKISLFAFFVRGRISWRSDERKIFCFQVEQSSGNFLTKTKKFIFLVEIPFEILPTITNKSSFLVEHKEMNFIGELMKAVHKEMALIGKPMKAARWGPIGVPILILCYSIG